LKDLALALFVGMISGAYSSVFIATPLLAQLKEREPDMKKLAARVASRRQRESQKDRPTTVSAATGATGAAVLDGEPAASSAGVATAGSRSSSRLAGDGAVRRPQPQHKPRSQRKR